MTGNPLLIHELGSGDPLEQLLASYPEGLLDEPAAKALSRQIKYLRCYLTDLGVSSVLEEQKYFDRDYLAEFAVFHSTSVRGYVNSCRRLHFFTGPLLERSLLEQAAGGNSKAESELQQRYRGFVVVRPIPWAPVGRTVLQWYAERQPETPRNNAPTREYQCHVAGITLKVRGVAWQQQDSAVGACATVALWSLFQVSANDEHHAIPTTADITRLAHKASSRFRLFPSEGLTPEQLCEAIKQRDLAPVALAGDLSGKDGFQRKRFSNSCAALLRSGFPVLIVGTFMGNEEGSTPSTRQHAVCAVGFRECSYPQQLPETVEFRDQDIRHLYINDDNLGPNVRFEILDGEDGKPVLLRASSPPRNQPGYVDDPSTTYPMIKPFLLIAAVREGLRMSPDALHARGLKTARAIQLALKDDTPQEDTPRIPPPSLHFRVHFGRLAQYAQHDLGKLLEGKPAVLAKARLALWEHVRPMSLYVGIVRIGCQEHTLFDILFDTTSADRQALAFCHLAFHRRGPEIIERLKGRFDLGASIEAF